VTGDKQISVVGDIPPATAQRIAQSVKLDKVQQADEGITP
jgi:sigma-E factor negative regulatory protein RseB